MARMGLILWDFAFSFMWAWAGSLAKLFVYSFLDWGHTSEAEALKLSLSVVYMYVFAWLAKWSEGGAYNPLTVLSSAFLGGPDAFIFTAFGRIPAQIAGSIIGVRLIKETFPQVGHGPRLNVDIHHGAMIEGLLTFMIVIISLGLKKKDPKSFFMKTWISTISKMTLHILGSDLTGGIMNPASLNALNSWRYISWINTSLSVHTWSTYLKYLDVLYKENDIAWFTPVELLKALGWAYARGDHISREHLLVYWLGPVQATVLAVWAFKLFTEPKKNKQH